MIISTPVVRLASKSDIEVLAPLFVSSLDTSIPGVKFSTLPLYTPDKVAPRLLERLFPPSSYKTYVLELPTGDIVGYANVKPNGGPRGVEDELDMFFVRADLGGRGYGGQLMKAIQADWSKRGLCLRVFERNERARRFYDKWGFRLVEGAEEKVMFSLADGPREETACLMRWSNTS